MGNEYIFCHNHDFLDVYCYRFFCTLYIVVSYLGKTLCHGPTLGDFLQKSETDLKIYFFRDYYVFGIKNRQNRDRFKVKTFFWRSLCFRDEKLIKLKQIQSCKFFLLVFDQLSGHGGTQGSSDNAQSVIQRTVYEASVNVATPN